MEQIQKSIESFVIGGDKNDVALLESVLHPQFRNIQDGFLSEKGIYVISKSEYIELVRNKTFGGNPRTINFLAIEQLDNIAIAKVDLKSQYLNFLSTIICVRVGGEWQIINNIPKVEINK